MGFFLVAKESEARGTLLLVIMLQGKCFCRWRRLVCVMFHYSELCIMNTSSDIMFNQIRIIDVFLSNMSIFILIMI